MWDSLRLWRKRKILQREWSSQRRICASFLVIHDPDTVRCDYSSLFSFWHPKFSYERIRQLIVLLRAIQAFKKEHDCDSWPTVLAGGESMFIQLRRWPD